MILPPAFYRRPDPTVIARELLGKVLVSEIGDQRTAGRITETEAYAHVGDRACHSHLGRFTDRTRVMYEPGGVAYCYLVYGLHVLFNLVTNEAGRADAVLIRAVEPLEGEAVMLARRGLKAVARNLTAGPGLLTQALGITKAQYGHDLTTGHELWIEDRGAAIAAPDILASPRVGIDYAGDDAALPGRFRVKGSRWTSPAR
ncbi:MAG: DNA-3-methyladenine glycosylase [Hymenobacteraceae bacterium]|nr:DNA-3-methyladenine glycosylase [Hymenobacteraceae bacterium]